MRAGAATPHSDSCCLDVHNLDISRIALRKGKKPLFSSVCARVLKPNWLIHRAAAAHGVVALRIEKNRIKLRT